MCLLCQFPVSECLCFKSLCPRMGISLASFGFSIGQQGCVSQKWALANISRKGHLITRASYDLTPPHARCCSAVTPVLMGLLLLSSLPVEIFSMQPVVSLLRDASPDPEWESQQSPASTARHPFYIGRSLFCSTHSAFCICVFSSLPPTPSDLYCALLWRGNSKWWVELRIELVWQWPFIDLVVP